MAKSKQNRQKSKQAKRQANPQNRQTSTRRSGPSVLQPPSMNMASNVGRQSEIALPVRKGLSTLTIHPDNTRWLGEAAPSFQKWGMHDLTLWYEPRVATSTNGQIALTFLSDFADRSPNSLEETVSLAGAQRGAPWGRFHLAKLRNRLFDYCSLRDFAAGDGTTKNERSPGRIVAWADMDASFDDEDIVGWVYISYKPVLLDPTLRRLQIGNTGNTGPPVEGYPDSPSDYYYHIKEYSNKWDFLGILPDHNPTSRIIITPSLAYSYHDIERANILWNTRTYNVRFFIEVLLRDFSKLSSREAIKFMVNSVHLDDGNKGQYVAWDNGDVLYRLCGTMEPGGYFYLDPSYLVSWRNAEMFCFELGEENGPEHPAIGGETVSALVKTKPASLELASENALVTQSFSGSFGASLDMGVSVRSQTSVDPPGRNGGYDLTPSLRMLTGTSAKAAANGLAAPANQLTIGFKNTGTKAISVFVTLVLLDFKLKYATTPVTALVANGSVMDNFTRDRSSGNATDVTTNVTLQPGGYFTWGLENRSSLVNSSQYMESVGSMLMTVGSSNVMWASEIPTVSTVTVSVPNPSDS